jgi:hypothetical protein
MVISDRNGPRRGLFFSFGASHVMRSELTDRGGGRLGHAHLTLISRSSHARRAIINHQHNPFYAVRFAHRRLDRFPRCRGEKGKREVRTLGILGGGGGRGYFGLVGSGNSKLIAKLKL